MTSEIKHDPIYALLVDDSAFARDVGKRVLTTAGVTTVEEASSGQAALDALGRTASVIDIVFCDLMMPDMDGVQFVRHAATLPMRPAFVFVSGAGAALLNTAEDMARARGLRVLGVIQKPLNVDAIHGVLSKLKRPAADQNLPVLDITARDLETALAKEQFVLHFQPKVALADNSVVGFESLVRWQHPDQGMIPPAAFIALAEEGGQIGPLTDHITMLALSQQAAWAKAGLHTKISVNLSAYMLVDLDLPDRMADEANRIGIDPQHVILEITESGLFQDAANTLDILARLHMKGFPLSIDDFGTGYSSMEQLRRVPFAEMKIDRSFVRGAGENAKVRAILKSSADLGRSLGLSVVAEGAETEEDYKGLREAGVGIVQGYFIAKPMAAEYVPYWHMTWTSKNQNA